MAIEQVLNVDVQEVYLYVRIGIHCDGPAVICVVWVGAWVKRGGYLSWTACDLIPIHWESRKKVQIFIENHARFSNFLTSKTSMVFAQQNDYLAPTLINPLYQHEIQDSVSWSFQ